jgi:CBS domain containing-hemolysin-like protein
MIILLTVVFLTLFISSQCSLYESTLYSTRIGTLEAAKVSGKSRKLATKMIKLKKEISIPIAAILILNTIANTAGATVAGMYAHKALGSALVPVFSIVFTLCILFFSEIIPKTLGAFHWRKIWPFIVWPLTIMNKSLYPIIKITEKLSDILTGGKPMPQITEEEILGAIRLGHKEGEISEWESQVAHNIINLENKQIREVMTPRTVMYLLDSTLSVNAALKEIGKRGITRIPVYEQDKDNITGYVTIHDLASTEVMGKPEAELSPLIKPITFQPATKDCLVLLTEFLRKRYQIAIVEDEYGSVVGLITLEDLMETLLGTEIVDEKDVEPDLQKLARKEHRKKRSRQRDTD